MIDIRYGAYQFEPGLQTYTFAMRPTYNDTFLRASQTYEAAVEGYLLVPASVDDVDAPAYLIRKINEFKAAMSIDGQDFRTRNTAGEVIDQILSAEILGGLRVIEGPIFQENGPGELVRKRSFRVVFGGEKILVNELGGGTPANVSKVQSVTYEGDGGPRFVLVETMNTPPVRQQINQSTKCRCVQEGTIVRRYSRPAIPAPLYPASEQHSQRRVGFVEREGNTFEVNWIYVFERETPFN